MGDGGGADDADGQHFITAPQHHPVCGNAPINGHQGDGNAQKLNNPLGKILRIDVNGRNSRRTGCIGVPGRQPLRRHGRRVSGEIWAYGFRNPYRILVRQSKHGDLFVGDVGQNDIEEVDIVVKRRQLRLERQGRDYLLQHQRQRRRLRQPRPDLGRAIPLGLIDPIAHKGHRWLCL